MAKHKRRRFRLKNIKRLFCCCCPFGKKSYSLDECDDGEDDLRGRFTPTWRVNNIEQSNSVSESLYGQDSLMVSQRNPDEKDEVQSIPLHIISAVKRGSLLQETDVMRENPSIQVLEAQMWENYSFQIIQSHRPEYASIQITAIQRWGVNTFHILHDHAREPLPHTAICILPANNETMVFQNTVSCLERLPVHIYAWARCKNISQWILNLDILRRYLPLPTTSLMHRRQGDVYSRGSSVLVSFLHLLSQGTYDYEIRIQTFRNHCLIKYQSMFVPAYPAIFSFIFGSAIYTITTSSVSFQMMEAIECTNRSDDNWGNDNDAENTNDDNKSDVDDNETDDHDVIQKQTNDSTSENKSDNGGSISIITGNNTLTKTDLIIVCNNLDFQNRLPKSDVLRKSRPNKYSGIPRYCYSKLHIQDPVKQIPARSKQNGRVRIKATLSAASDPPPDGLTASAGRFMVFHR